MGREASCICEWNGETARVKVLLEPPELILRGEIKRRIAIASLKQIAARGARLDFRVDGESYSLEMGEAQAAKWAQALLKPPPTLAQKLGITSGSAVRVIGTVDDDALSEALAEAHTVTRGAVHVIIARVDTSAQVADAWKKAATQVENGAALWMIYPKGRMIYPKGRGHSTNETTVREAGLAAGFVDVKVASVSAQLTGLKFVRRKNAR
jgi:hypothetical protein